ncbi:MAG: insulinase family protein [Alphaproteobacteria bacterium]|nr:MAG: insulinase family protein [Alphaproteobacteria bacterium]
MLIFIGGHFVMNAITPKNNLSSYDLNIDIKETFLDKTKTWMMKDKTSKLVHIKFVFKNTGHAFEQKQGSLSVLDNMIFEGAGALDAYHFQEFLSNNQVHLTFSFGPDDNEISIQTPPKNLNIALKALTLIFENLRLDPDEFKRAKEQLLLNLEQSKLEPTSLASDHFNKYAFKKHPYFDSIENKIIHIKAITPEDVKNALKQHFTSDRLSCVVLGNFDETAAESFIQSVKTLLQSTSILPTSLPPLEFQNTGKKKYFFMDVPQSVILFRTTAIPVDHPDFHALQLFNTILGASSFSSRLWFNIRESKGLAYNIGTALFVMRYASMLKGRMGTSTYQVEDALKILETTIKDTVEKGVTQKELDHQKQFVMGSFLTSFDSLGEMSRVLSTYITDLSLEGLKNRNKKIQALTLKEVNDAGKKHIKCEDLTFCILGNHKVD